MADDAKRGFSRRGFLAGGAVACATGVVTLVHGVLAPTMDGPFADRTGCCEDDPSSKRVPKGSRLPRTSNHCTPFVLVDQPGAHRRRVQAVNRWDRPHHAARFRVTTGKCRLLC